MSASFSRAQNRQMPRIFYGTAWKEDRTESFVEEALRSGFTAIDTANQRKHYYEEGVGRAINKFLKNQNRESIFIQTKFSPAMAQDHRKPYEDNDPINVQVQKSFQSSLEHLGVEAIDSYILHGPTTRIGLSPEDWEAWRAMEKLYQEGSIKFLGVSNFSLDQLQSLYESAQAKPYFIQNRCFASMAWDKSIRHFCQKYQIYYQAFSLLTANARELSVPLMKDLSQKYNKSIAQLIFRFSQQLDMIPLTGTTDPQHMREDLDIDDLELTQEELQQIEKIAA